MNFVCYYYVFLNEYRLHCYVVWHNYLFVSGDMDGMKNSPQHGGPGTPRDDLPPSSSTVTGPDMSGYPSLSYQDNVSQMSM